MNYILVENIVDMVWILIGELTQVEQTIHQTDLIVVDLYHGLFIMEVTYTKLKVPKVGGIQEKKEIGLKVQLIHRLNQVI